MRSLQYRPEIDGLRAISVISVVLYHFDISAVKGGFIGVDVFFVISGYLITGIIAKSIAGNSLTIKDFYVRRIKRIIPAYFAMVAATLIAGIIFLIPTDLINLSKSAISTALFFSNIYFWISSGDYFATPAENQPLLHMWSLSVEEQFYIFFPIILSVLMRFFQIRIVHIALLFGLIFSFFLSVWAVENAHVAAFFLLPSRAWELLIGSVLAMRIIPQIQLTPVNEVIGLLGIGLIMLSVFFIDTTTPFPGFGALAPCFGAAMVIFANNKHLTFSGKLLSNPVLVFFGLISYSLYLWHWPIVVFAKYIVVDEPSLTLRLALIALSVLVAWLSLLFIERPFRSGHLIRKEANILLAGAGSLIAIAIVGFVFKESSGFPNRMPQDVLTLLETKGHYGEERSACHNIYSKGISTPCTLGAPDIEPTLALVGDSHTGAIGVAFFDRAKRFERSGFQFSEQGWCPSPGYIKWGEAKKYERMNERFESFLSSHPTVNQIYLVCYWDQAISENKYYSSNGTIVSGQEAFATSLDALFKKNPKIDFITMYAPPVYKKFGKDANARRMLYTDSNFGSIPTSEYLNNRNLYKTTIDQLTQRNTNFHALDPKDYICDEIACKDIVAGQFMYRDSNHLSSDGAISVAPIFDHFLLGK